jgi:hypothetical protein
MPDVVLTIEQERLALALNDMRQASAAARLIGRRETIEDLLDHEL